MTTEKTSAIVQIHKVYIRATPQAIWDAITRPEWTERYGYKGRSEFELRPGGAFRTRSSEELIKVGLPEVAVDGEVVSSDPPRKLVHTYRFRFSPAHEAEGFTRVTWEISDTGAGFSLLTVTHELDGAPMMAGMLGSDFSLQGAGGWSWILNDLKSVLETGKSMAD